MIKIVDRKGEVVVQKVTKPDGTLVRYQHGIPGQVMRPFPTLEEAHIAMSKEHCDAR